MPALGSYALPRFIGAGYLQDELSPSVRRPFFFRSVYESRESEYCSVLVIRKLEGMWGMRAGWAGYRI